MKNNIEWLDYKALMLSRPNLFSQNQTLEIIFDENIIETFEKNNNVTIGVVYKSKFNILLVDLIQSDNVLFTYERVIPRNQGAVVSVPIFENKLLLLKQYRHATRSIEYSFPRGFGEPNISAWDNIKKEIKEEIGGIATEVSYLGKLSPDSGLTSNIVEVYSCRLERYKKQHNHEGILDVLLFTEEELKGFIKEGKIIDNFTISAFYMYLNN